MRGAPTPTTLTNTISMTQINANGTLGTWAAAGQVLPTARYSPGCAAYNGHFYVTGYTGQGGGFKNPCEAASPSNYAGLYPDDPVPNGDSGLIVGHFIRFVDSVGGDGSVACDPNSINACVIVMTR